MIKRNLFKICICMLLAASACSTRPDAQSIIDKAIETHGGEAFEHSRIAFDFRDVHFTAERRGDDFTYTRFFPDSLGGIRDTLTNNGFSRAIDGQKTNLSFEKDSAYSNSVNSVIYFALLPYKLNDPAVNKNLLGKVNIKGEPYYKIEVTFDKNGGGDDYQDRYMYWIHRNNYTMDYLAYRFHVDGGGTRFREAKNVRTINGIRFADYNNFGSPKMEHPLKDYDAYFEADTLTKVSEVNLENVEVTLLNEQE